jgi:hypothetical protein
LDLPQHTAAHSCQCFMRDGPLVMGDEACADVACTARPGVGLVAPAPPAFRIPAPRRPPHVDPLFPPRVARLCRPPHVAPLPRSQIRCQSTTSPMRMLPLT